MGVAVGDFDNHGFSDLYVTNYGSNVLYKNNGDGTFLDVTEQAGVSGGLWSASAGFLDYDRDGFLDLYVTRYVDWSLDNSPGCGKDSSRSYVNSGLKEHQFHRNKKDPPERAPSAKRR